MRRHIVIALAPLCFLLGCDTDRVNRLEKENADLRAAVARTTAATDFSLQEKCSSAAKSWFRENYPPDKDTVLLDETNHYNRKMNKCFVMVEYHFNNDSHNIEWTNDMAMWNVFENEKYATFTESHETFGFNSKLPPRDEVITCEVAGSKCKSIDEFNNLTRSYMGD